MKKRASITSLEDVARLQKQSEELEKVCAQVVSIRLTVVILSSPPRLGSS